MEHIGAALYRSEDRKIVITKAQYENRFSPLLLPIEAKSVSDVAADRGVGDDLATLRAVLHSMEAEGWLLYSYNDYGELVYMPPGTQIEGVNC